MSIRTYLARLFAPPAPPPRRLVDVELALSELEDKVEWLTKDFKKLRGRVTGGLKKEPQDEEVAQPENDGDASPALTNHPPGSAHLAARFRRF